MKYKVSVTRDFREGDSYTVALNVGHQGFTFDYHGTKTDCQWYAKMVRIALKNIKEKP